MAQTTSAIRNGWTLGNDHPLVGLHWSIFDQCVKSIFIFQPKKTLHPVALHKFWITDTTCSQISWVLHAMWFHSTKTSATPLATETGCFLLLSLIHYNTVVDSVLMKIPLKLHSRSITNIFFNLVAVTTAIESNFGMVRCFIGVTPALPMTKLTCLYSILAVTTCTSAKKVSPEATPKTCSSCSWLLIILYHLCTAIGLFCDNSKIQVLKVLCKLFSIGLSHCCP